MSVHDRRGRPISQTGRVEPHAVCANAVLLFRAIPQLGLKFAEAIEVPRSRVTGDDPLAVRCRCDAVTPVPLGHVAECVGECGRYFLRVRDRVRAVRLGDPDAAAA